MAICLGSHEGEKSQKTSVSRMHKSPFAFVLNITLCSLDVNIGVVCTTASDKGQERRYLWKNHIPYHLQHVLFVSSQLTIFAENNGQE